MVVPRPTLHQALFSPEFGAVLGRLIAYAGRRLRRVGWPEGRDHLPGAAEATEVVDAAIDSCLSGARVWPEGVPLEGFLRGVIRSVVSHWREQAEGLPVTALDEIAEGVAAPSSRRDAVLAARRLLRAVERELADDADLSALLANMAGPATTRAERAVELGWTPARVTAAYVKMNRRLRAAGLHDGEDDERPRRDRSPRNAAAPRRGAR
jgi:hypothetical protein